MILSSAHIATSVFLGIVAIGALYFVPSIIALVRHHHRKRAIFLLNLFLGVTAIGWLGALWWSFTDPHPKHGAHVAPAAPQPPAPPAAPPNPD